VKNEIILLGMHNPNIRQGNGDNMSWYSWVGTLMLMFGGVLWMAFDWHIIARTAITIFMIAGYLILKYTKDPKLDSKS
jgi:hypothetical protein